MGACGSGSGGQDPKDRTYTRECLEHDVHSYLNNSIHGPFEINSSGLKFLEAIPSYLLYGER